MSVEISSFIERRRADSESWAEVAQMFLEDDRELRNALFTGPVKRRGMPPGTTMSYSIRQSELFLKVLPGSGSIKPDEFESWITELDAEQLLSRYPSLFATRDKEGRLLEVKDLNIDDVTWLHPSEFRSALESTRSIADMPSNFRAALLLMESLASEYGGTAVRIIIWTHG